MIYPGTQESVLIDKLPGLVIVAGREGIVHGLNQTTVDFAGRAAQEMIGVSIGEALGCLHCIGGSGGCSADPLRETCPVFRSVLDTLETGKDSHRVEAKLAYTHRGGPQERHVYVSTSPIRLVDGEDRVLVYIEDNTKYKEVEEALRDSEEKLRQMFDSVVDGLAVADLNGFITEANDRVLQMHGFSSKDEVLGKHAIELIAPCDHEKAMAHMRRIAEQGPVDDNGFTLVRRDGSEFPAELSASVLRDASGKAVGFIAITRDITNRKRAEEELKIRDGAMASSINAIALADLEGNLIFVNLSFLHMWGYDDDKEVLGKPAIGFWQTGERAEAVIQALLDRGSWRGELVGLRRDGSTFEVEMLASIVSADDGRNVCIMASFMDITERKRAEEELQRHTRSVEALHTVAEAISQTLELDGMLNSVLEKVLDVTGVEAGYIQSFDAETRIGSVRAYRGLPRSFVERVEEQATEEDVRRWLESKEPAFGLRQMYREPYASNVMSSAEEEGLQSFLAMPLWSKTTLLGGLVLVSRYRRRFGAEDLELLKAIANQIAVGMENSQLFERAQAQVDELKAAHEYFVQTEKRRALAEMAGGVAHDFNNILAVILGRAQLALEEAKEPKVRKSLQVIEQTAEDAAKMVLRLRDSARAESHEEFQELDPQLLVITALQMVETRRAESQLMGVKIDIATDLSELLPVEGKAGELRQVLINIIFNAMDALPHGGQIKVRTRQETGWAVISISDTGEGMAEDVKAKIFDPFFSTKGAAGLGLGLSTTHGIVAEHGGSIEVASTPEKGSTFAIRLPVAKNARRKLLGSKDISGTDTGARILLVDDETEVVEVLESIIDKLGHKVTAVNSGRAALEAMRSEEYDLLITDLHMPGISGHDVATAFKQARAGVPVLMITGWGLQVDRSELAADAVLAKPVTKEALSQQIAAALK